jgi:hypothetical protein
MKFIETSPEFMRANYSEISPVQFTLYCTRRFWGGVDRFTVTCCYLSDALQEFRNSGGDLARIGGAMFAAPNGRAHIYSESELKDAIEWVVNNG